MVYTWNRDIISYQREERDKKQIKNFNIATGFTIRVVLIDSPKLYSHFDSPAKKNLKVKLIYVISELTLWGVGAGNNIIVLRNNFFLNSYIPCLDFRFESSIASCVFLLSSHEIQYNPTTYILTRFLDHHSLLYLQIILSTHERKEVSVISKFCLQVDKFCMLVIVIIRAVSTCMKPIFHFCQLFGRNEILKFFYRAKTRSVASF